MIEPKKLFLIGTGFMLDLHARDRDLIGTEVLCVGPASAVGHTWMGLDAALGAIGRVVMHDATIPVSRNSTQSLRSIPQTEHIIRVRPAYCPF